MSRSMTIFLSLLLLLSLIGYVSLIATLCSLNSSDHAGNGLSQAFGVLATIGLWILLAAILFIAGNEGTMPGWAMFAALVLVPASSAAALAAGHLLKDSFYHAKWPLVIPTVSPLLIIGFACWAYFPALRSWVPVMWANSVTWGALLILSALPWYEVVYRSRHRVADQAKVQAAAPQRAEEERARNLAAFRQLTPASEFSQWMEFNYPDNELRAEALAAIRQLPQRQVELEALFQRGYDYLVDQLPDFDLQPTPVVSEAARRHLKQKVIDLTPRNPSDPPRFSNMVDRIEPSLPAIKWLVAQRVSCENELDAIEQAVRMYPESPERNRFLEAFVEARKAW